MTFICHIIDDRNRKPVPGLVWFIYLRVKVVRGIGDKAQFSASYFEHHNGAIGALDE